VATIVWDWLSYSLRPDLFTGNMGVMMTSPRGLFDFTLILMADCHGHSLFWSLASTLFANVVVILN
jgi:hypothetical protein